MPVKQSDLRAIRGVVLGVMLGLTLWLAILVCWLRFGILAS